MSSKPVQYFTLIAVAILLIGCASQGPPGGGPRDTIAPYIAGTTPKNGSVSVDPDTEIKIEFSEYVDPNSFAENLFLSPTPEEEPDIVWNGKTVEIKLHDGLTDFPTLVVTVGSNVRDLRSNNLESSYTLAFTTRDSLAKGRIEGLVYGKDDFQGMVVGAWNVSADSLIDPAEKAPPYLTQVSKENTYSLDYLPSGIYRVLCWEDKDRDRLYEPGGDLLGIGWKDVILPQDSKRYIDFFPAVPDTGRTSILMVSSLDRRHVQVRLNRKLDTDPFSIAPKFAISDSLSELPVITGWFNAGDSSKITLVTGNQYDREYKLSLKSDTTDVKFTGSTISDTTGPRITQFSPADDARNVPFEANGWIAFDDALKRTIWDSVISMRANDSIDVKLWVQQLAANLLTWKVQEPLEDNIQCELSIDLTRIEDIFQNPFPFDKPDTLSKESEIDTLETTGNKWSISFRTLNSVETGSISGEIQIENVTSAISINAVSVSGRSGKIFPGEMTGRTSFKIDFLPGGKYNLFAFLDRNGDNEYHHGTINPFSFSERFTLRQDSIEVRERWETSRKDIYFR